MPRSANSHPVPWNRCAIGAAGRQGCATIPAMAWPELDTAAVARALSQIAEQPEDLVDAFFERREDVELPP